MTELKINFCTRKNFFFQIKGKSMTNKNVLWSLTCKVPVSGTLTFLSFRGIYFSRTFGAPEIMDHFGQSELLQTPKKVLEFLEP